MRRTRVIQVALTRVILGLRYRDSNTKGGAELNESSAM
jgi:hypothetical protein